MTAEMIFVALMIVLMLLGLLFEAARADLIVFFFLVVFLLTGIISTEQALSGFSNEGMLTVLLLFIVAGAIQKHGIIENYIDRLLSDHRGTKRSMIKLLAPISLFSGFLNNTPIVVTLTPILKNWCQQNGIAPSKFLIPLSYVTILGGTITLIGTSTNLVVHGLLIQSGREGFGFFQLSVVGLPIAVAGLIYIFTLGYRLLPDTLGAKEQIRKEVKEFLAEAVIEKGYEHINGRIVDAVNNSLKGIYIIEIIRNDTRIFPVTPNTIIEEGDHLLFSGTLNTIASVQKQKGITLKTGTDQTLDSLKDDKFELIEAVISHQSGLVGKSVKSAHFRSKYNAGVIAVHRNNERIKGRVGEIMLKPGDTILLLAGNDFMEMHMHSIDFYVVTSLSPPEPLNQSSAKGWAGLALLLVMISSVTLGFLSMFEAMLIAVILLMLFKFIDADEMLSYIQFNVILLIASAFGVGAAMMESGLAQFLAENMLMIARPLGVIGVIAILYIMTNIFTELITNTGAAVLMFPIAMEMATQMDMDYMGLTVTIAIAASASFITPIGYQTNLIVYGPGGYKFTDYIKVGAPLSLMTMVISTLIIYTVWF
ncbi:SLC13 family permease [Salinicoccus roseus]|uniref:SLC13 family permease n=1 Tax=Salinicoccus roseus TaxID=45670 RepID=A0A265EAC6_9STAP|nr:SLC13 family permease [Salinicoccus roseus]OZT78539.1 SLC13 family permease [Salinicoccus roseus]RPE54647.1 di/tricarboxylate transporter [Salinicoccus roseus]GGA63859.1 sodium:sulfate symporter [Salinicoccus roseus]